jgi:hypothetical protein
VRQLITITSRPDRHSRIIDRTETRAHGAFRRVY